MESKQVNKTNIKKQSYKDGLEPVVKARYLEKLKIIGGIDPYEQSTKSFSDDKKLLPSVTYPDIVNYLLFTPSPYTKDDLKALKSLEAYNQAQNGWVSDVRAIDTNSKRVVTAKVLHSMWLREKPLNPWSIINSDGTIQASHCDCIAGLGEVCSHVAAMLFTVMEIVRIRDSQTVTQDPAYWKFPASLKKVEYKEVRFIDFTSAKSLKKKFEKKLENENAGSSDAQSKKSEKQIPKPTTDEINEFLYNLHKTGQKAAILSVSENFADEYVPIVEKKAFPTMLNDLKHKDAIAMDYCTLLKQTDCVEIKVSREEINNVEAATREQANNKLWHDFRAGRITASKMKQVCSTDPSYPSQSLIMSLCYPEKKMFSTDATKWGVSNEAKARDMLLNKLKQENKHMNISVVDCGLYISEERPFIAATPDGIIECDCCGQSVIEIKCPYAHRGSSLKDEIANFYLVKNEDGQIVLDKNHQYYYQVQTQIGVTQLTHAYFVVWTEVDLHVEVIKFDPDFFEQMCTRAEKIFRVAVLPELVGKFYSRLPGSRHESCVLAEKKTTENVQSIEIQCEDKTWCYCDQVESGQMIACDNENCQIVWFHFTCLKMDAPPKVMKWYCPDCRKLPEFKRKRKTRD